MKQIYNFEAYEPPEISEEAILLEARRRELKMQSILLGLAGLLTDICIVLMAFFISPVSLVLSVALIAALCFSLIGSGLISILFIQRRRRLYYGYSGY